MLEVCVAEGSEGGQAGWWFGFLGFEVFFRDDVDEKIKDLSMLNAGCNIALLEGPALGLFSVGPGPVGELNNEDFTGLSKEYWRL